MIKTKLKTQVRAFPPSSQFPRGRQFLICVLWIAGIAAAQLATAAAAADSNTPEKITQIRISTIHDSGCKQAPVTFGQPFVKGDLPRGKTVRARLDGHSLPTQLAIKARNRDGSARHGVVTVGVPCSVGDSGKAVDLVAVPGSDQASQKPAVTLEDVLSTQFDTRITLDIDNKIWHLDARDLLEKVKNSGGCGAVSSFCKKWLTGSLTSEWVVGAPLVNAKGKPHPHLAAYFAVRAYGPAPVQRVRVDVAVENDWAYEQDPQNYKYQPTIHVAGRSTPAYHPKGFTHYLQARWHHVVWWGASDKAPLYARLGSSYLQSTAAVPKYEHGKLDSGLAGGVRQSCAPMQSCDQTKHMENTGSQAAIGPLPRWSAAYVIDPSYPMFRWMIANSDALGAYAVHYREKRTGQPLSIKAHPCATQVGPAEQAKCKVSPHGDDRFPDCDAQCDTPLHPDASHHPAPAYVAYLATGDWYYESELIFWADWAIFWQNPKYRDYTKGLVHKTQVRGQAWMLRTIGDAAYLLPDNAVYKEYFNQVVSNNLAWYNKHYTDNPDANKLGLIDSYHAVVYKMHGQARTGIAPWQQSFFTWAVGNLADQRFAGARALRDWVSQFQIGQMTARGYCWELASAYEVRVRDTQKSPIYDTFSKVYDKSFPDLKSAGCTPDKLNNALAKQKGKNKFPYPPGTMVGYPSSATGFVANFQIGLAAAANADVDGATKAWRRFAHRSVQPNYSHAPQFAVVPSS